MYLRLVLLLKIFLAEVLGKYIKKSMSFNALKEYKTLDDLIKARLLEGRDS